MNLTVPAKPLADAASLLSGLTGKHTQNIPILGVVLVTDSGEGELHLAASNLDLSVRVSLTLEQPRLVDPREESIAVPTDVLVTQLKAIAALSETVTLRTMPNGRLNLKAKRTSVNVVASDGSEFPSMIWALPDAAVRLPRKDLGFLLRSVAPASDTSVLDTSALTGVQLTAIEDQMRVAACDQKRLNVATLHVGEKRGELFTIFLPRHMVSHALRFLLMVGEEEPVSLGLNANLIVLWARGFTLVSRQVGQRSFPDYGPLMNGDASRKILVKRLELSATLAAAMPFADRGSQITPRVELHYRDNSLAVFCQNETVGEFQAEIEAQSYDSPAFKLAVNPVFVRDFLHACDADDIAIVGPANKQTVLQLRPAGEGGTAELVGWCMGMV